MKNFPLWPDRICCAGLITVALCAYIWLGEKTSLADWLTTAVAVLPPLALIYIGYRRVRQWAEYIALIMIPYSCIGIMDIVASSRGQAVALVMSLAAILTFFAALDASRRSRL
jgi:uncharacterized membrane protein